MKIKSFDRPSLKMLRNAIQSALNPVIKEYGIDLSLGTIRFDRASFRAKLTGEIPGVNTSTFIPTINFGNGPSFNTTPETPTSTNRLASALALFGIPKDARRFRVHNSVYMLVDAKTSRPKYPFIGAGVRGGRYRFTVDQVKNGLMK